MNRSLLFYSDQIVDTNIQNGKNKKEESNKSDYTLDKNYLDTQKYKASIEKISNILYGMGEQEIAVYYKNNLPLGLQLIGKAFDEQTILNLSLAIEKRANFKKNYKVWWN